MPCVSQAFFFEYSDNPNNSCIDAVRSNEKFESLKSAFRSDESTFLLYSKKNKPTEAEQELIAKYMSAMDWCRNQPDARMWRKENGDAVRNVIFDSMYSAYVAQVVRLYGGEITYGEYHMALDVEKAAREQQLAARAEELDRLGAQASQANSDHEVQRALLMRQAIQGVQKSMQPRQPIRTDCYFLGGQLRCKTQ
jgi:hypothetical protein